MRYAPRHTFPGLLACLLAAGACAGEARFVAIDYRGDDGGPEPASMQYRNPVIAGFHPDPSAIRVGDDYYLVASSFGYYPGLPLFHSTDLVSWRQIGNAIDRTGQMPYGDGEELTRGLFAATIAHDGQRFYIASTCFYCPGRGMGNFVITADDPAGPWSDPVWLAFDGIDPSLFFDGDGRAWLVHNDVPQGPMRYDGHRAIWLRVSTPPRCRLPARRSSWWMPACILGPGRSMSKARICSGRCASSPTTSPRPSGASSPG